MVTLCLYIYELLKIRLTEWAPMLNVKESHLCNLYYIRTASDQYGCQVNPSEFNLSEPVLKIIDERGIVDAEVFFLKYYCSQFLCFVLIKLCAYGCGYMYIFIVCVWLYVCVNLCADGSEVAHVGHDVARRYEARLAAAGQEFNPGQTRSMHIC